MAAPSDQSTGNQWYNGYTEIPYINARATAVGTGQANTSVIIIAQGAGAYAARLTANLVLGGYYDWFLPSKDELNLMYKNIGRGAQAPLTDIGGFDAEYYWSSSEHANSGLAWSQYSWTGSQNANYQKLIFNVRAVRAF